MKVGQLQSNFPTEKNELLSKFTTATFTKCIKMRMKDCFLLHKTSAGDTMPTLGGVVIIFYTRSVFSWKTEKVILLIHKPKSSNDLVNNRSFTVIADHLTTGFIRKSTF